MPPPRPPVASPPPPPPLPPGGARATPYAPPNDIVPREAQAAEHGGLLGRSGAVDGAEAEAGGRTQARGEEGFARGKRARMDGEGREDGGARQGAQDLPRAGTGGGGGTVFLAPSLIRLSNVLVYPVPPGSEETVPIADRGGVTRYRGKELHCVECIRMTIWTLEENTNFLLELQKAWNDVSSW
eukprot:CAMPEP_0194302806 /NCGR_PEP_ID=MMETSP0171-20130528/674_1 /TAXON_ID=218684 /ORGANISM="Corethron pennatum, Strain L29A3" /LENGTH=183 /DNA_ID=CAMNT_0039053439 /DNA_START=584 /DNA_END=1136 /DNA_ORIENTATION=-